ncbi:putative RNA-directed DNA polymerase [Helianthus annuus]|nr:putative RNA-directed DNA polymerase [Helianthus annuus]
MEVLDMLTKRAVELGLFHGLRLPNNGPLLSHLCYADDVLFIGEWSKHNVVSLSRFLRCLHLLTGLKVNHQKCHLFGIGVEEEEVNGMSRILKCEVGSLPFTYLGIPIGANMKTARHWQPVVEKFNKKLSAWKAKTLSFAGRVTLVKAVLGSLPSYYLSLFLAPKCIIKKLEGLRRDFVWGRMGLQKKIRWVQWGNITKPKSMGGIGLGGIREFNVAMISKWWWRYKDNPNQLWAKVVSSIHAIRNHNNLIPLKKTIPGIWKDVGSIDR